MPEAGTLHIDKQQRSVYRTGVHHLPSNGRDSHGDVVPVVYVVIFMIWLETPIVNDVMFRQHIRLYKRFIDDLFLMRTGTGAVLCDFRRALATADEAIGLDWSGYESHQEAADP